jgi:uncharacterized protein YraI
MIVLRKILVALGLLTAATLGVAGSAEAASSGYLTANVSLRAGPGFDYPVVASMNAGSGVTIYGCLSGWSWCDISWRGNRGWASGQYLQVVYQNQRRPILGYGTYIGLPFVTFSIGNYWGNYYRHRPFFNQINRWGGPGFHPPKGPKPPYMKPPHGNNPPSNGNNPPNGGKPNFKPPHNGNQPPFGNSNKGNYQKGNGPKGNGPKGNGPNGCKPGDNNCH